jgi:hypothetical protein
MPADQSSGSYLNMRRMVTQALWLVSISVAFGALSGAGSAGAAARPVGVLFSGQVRLLLRSCQPGTISLGIGPIVPDDAAGQQPGPGA